METDPEDGTHPLNDPVFVVGRHRLPYAPLDRIFLNQPDLAGSLFLIRHGRQEMPRTVSREHFLDPPLDDVGRRQAAAVAERMKRFDLQRIYCSDLQRARDTAGAIADATGVPIAGELPELREIDLYRDLAVAEILGVRADMVFNPAHCSITWLRYAPDSRREIHSLNLVEHLLDDDLLTY
ncbi:histidine phosphatase family protein [Sporichthya polymorpha]|uniref:histidine phosphatase family protein n=1 Tax=Sporichthya polymorpha TaxID=35751 RepID=UPI00037B8AE9|nr:histidine phosphatase family protein [Sporichthya polymorpha]